MPKTNSESDFGGSLTSDAEDDDIDAGPSSPLRERPYSIVTQGFGEQVHQNNPTSPKNPRESLDRAHPSPRSPLTSPGSRRRPLSSQNHDRQDDHLKRPRLRGAALFRAAAHKVMRMHKTSSLWGTLSGGRAGAEPGVDPRHHGAHIAFGHIKQACSISLIEYNSIRTKFRSFKNQSFIDFLDTQGTEKEPWAKVRWIHVAGISWDVISRLALAYDLHPLSLEDILQDQQKLARSKADYFHKHLFIRVLCHQVASSEEVIPEQFSEGNITDVPRSSSPLPMLRPGSFKMRTLSSDNTSSLLKRKTTRRKSSLHEEELEQGPEPPPYDEIESRSNTAEEAVLAIQQLKQGLRVNVLRRNLYMFLFRDGTLITIYQTNTPSFATPIMNRLRTPSTVLRSNSDPSILLESILDLVVDQATEVVEEYQKILLKLESDILLKPKVGSVRHLHIISGELALHKRTFEPLRSLIYGLRRYDYDRCLALETSSTGESEGVPKVVGYMSHKSKIYLADVNDHMEYILSSLDMFGGIAENLINYTFNMASYEMNEVMRRLTLATIIFLPLTLLTGYFGMNFNIMPSVQDHSDALFWEIAIPVMAVVVPLFMWSDIIRVKHYIDKKWDIRYRRTNRI